MARLTTKQIWAEMARRKLQFHKNEQWHQISLWGLFNWGTVSRLIKNGLLITDMRKDNKIVWVTPSEKAWTRHIRPLCEQYTLDQLTRMAGW